MIDTMNKESLLVLAARVEALTEPDRDLDHDIFNTLNPDKAIPYGRRMLPWVNQYTKSVDDALTLIPLSKEASEILHTAWSAVSTKHALHVRFWKEIDGDYGHALALAICAAALRAHAEKLDV